MLSAVNIKHAGRCHCGRIVFEFDGQPSDASFCHCSLCRRLTGSAFGSWCEIPDAHFRWLQGERALIAYAATEKLEIRFCNRCGTTLRAVHRDFPEVSYIPLGVVDDSDDIEPAYHQFIASKASWYRIHGSLPRYTAWPEEDSAQCGWGALEASRR